MSLARLGSFVWYEIVSCVDSRFVDSGASSTEKKRKNSGGVCCLDWSRYVM